MSSVFFYVLMEIFQLFGNYKKYLRFVPFSVLNIGVLKTCLDHVHFYFLFGHRI